MPWVMAMDWVDAFFLHWPLDPALLRERIPPDLTLDEFDGSAWISIVAFRIAAARPRGAPRALAWRTFPEINVRTYVTGGGHAGVWFFSLDAHSRLAVAIARTAVNLPYHLATIDVALASDTTAYRHVRVQRDAPAAWFDARASSHGDARPAAAGTLDQWLVERLAFFTVDRHGRTRRGDVAHAPWPLRETTVDVTANSLIDALGFGGLGAHALAHASPGVSTHMWPLQ